MGTDFSRHELERRKRAPKSLHEMMMLEAEPIIQHNWTDVAIHDKDKLASIPVGNTCIWVVSSMGSFLTPMYCKISERGRWTADACSTIAPIQYLIVRWHKQAHIFGDNRNWAFFHDPVRDRHCYLVTKTDGKGGGRIEKISYKELADMCVYGQRLMVVNS